MYHFCIENIMICFLPQYQRQRNGFFFSERELKKVLRDTLTRAVWYGQWTLIDNSKLAGSQIARLAAIVVKY